MNYTFQQVSKSLNNQGFVKVGGESHEVGSWIYFERPHKNGGVQQVTVWTYTNSDKAEIEGMNPKEWAKRCLPALNKWRAKQQEL